MRSVVQCGFPSSNPPHLAGSPHSRKDKNSGWGLCWGVGAGGMLKLCGLARGPRGLPLCLLPRC